MSKSNIQQRAEKAEHLMETLNSIFLGFIPGGHAAEAFLNYRDDLKTKRVLNFLEGFSLALQEIAEEKEIDMSVFTGEDFVDVFDCIIAKIQITKSELKINRFKRILLRQAVSINDDFLINRYIQFIEDLSDIQIIILDKLIEFNKPMPVNFIELIQNKNENITVNKLHKSIDIQVGKSLINIPIMDIDFYVNDLISRGLIINKKTTQRMSIPDRNIGENIIQENEIQKFELSRVGREFVSYLKE